MLPYNGIFTMNPSATSNLEPSTVGSAIHPATIPSTIIPPTLIRPNRFISDWRISVVTLTVLWAVIYMTGLSRPALLDDADTVHAEAAREMVLRHDWVTLYANGVRYLEKAPLMYWGVATSYTLFGVSEWSTRLPLMLGVLAMILATYGLGRWALGSAGGFDSGLVLATALGPFLFTRFLIPDAAVGLWLTLTFWLFSGVAGASQAGALDLLGTGRSVRAQRSYQGTDRAGVSHRRDRALPSADGKSAALAKAAPAVGHAGVSRGRRAVAHSGTAAKSGAGKRARISLVLLRQ